MCLQQDPILFFTEAFCFDVVPQLIHPAQAAAFAVAARQRFGYDRPILSTVLRNQLAKLLIFLQTCIQSGMCKLMRVTWWLYYCFVMLPLYCICLLMLT